MNPTRSCAFFHITRQTDIIFFNVETNLCKQGRYKKKTSTEAKYIW